MGASGQLGKEQALPCAENLFSLCGVRLCEYRLTDERAQAVLNCLSSFRGRNVVPLKQFHRLLGHMASAAAVTPLGLLHMRLTSALATNLVSRTHFPRDSTSMVHSSEEGPPLSGARHHMAPVSRSVEPPRVARGRDMADLSGLPPAVVETITQARAPSTRQTYELKWSLFANWCSSR